ncbi:MAG: sirohydrochlorin cobaltochelatase [Candidatus Magnetomorum sp.]|nr:sirohydrochlorin cobaltochelatase [Candidatus Magnetomorum sp.]
MLPIILAAFGTTTNAMKTYTFMDTIFRKRFSNHPIYWSFSSRVVRERMKKDHQFNMKQPQDVLTDVFQKGHTWAVVQSLHLTPGYEFDGLIENTIHHDMRVSIGLPLLYTPEDYYAVIQALAAVYDIETHFPDTSLAQIIIGHGTTHPIWTSCIALNSMIQQKWPHKGVYVSTIEYPLIDRKKLIQTIRTAGYTRVRLIPLLLVTGNHFLKDLSAPENSWTSDCESAGLTVTLEPNGLGYQPAVVDLFCEHIESAIDVIPGQS